MNDSLASADQKQIQTKSLFHEMNNVAALDDWKNQDFLFSPFVNQRQENNIQQQIEGFHYDLPLESKLEKLNQKNDIKLEENKQLMAKQQIKGSLIQSSVSSQNKISSQLTITLNEQSILTKDYNEVQTEQSSSYSTSLKSFLNLNQKSYRPHVIAMKVLFSNLKQFSKKSLTYLRIYIQFLELKMNQQIQSLKLYDQEDGVDKIRTEDLDQQLYIDQRAIINKIKQNSTESRDKIKNFYSEIKEIYQKLLNVWKKIKQKREKRQRQIEEDIIRIIDRIQVQMEDIIKCCLKSQRQKSQSKLISQKIRSQNPFLSKDKYLQIKYLMQRQNTYLELINNLNNKLLAYLINIFSKEEFTIYKTIKNCLIEYGEAYLQCYQNQNDVLIKQIQDIQQADHEIKFRNQLTQTLLSFLSKEIYNPQHYQKQKNQNDQLEVIISNFNSQIQNTIFLTTIQMNNQYILFRNEALWKTTSTFIDNDQNSIDFESKEVLNNNPTKKSKKNNISNQKSQNLKVIVVLTSNYYLHLQNNEKVATLKLGDIKLSKRGRQIIISDKSKGIKDFFATKKQLGRLQFQSIDQVQIFSQKLSQALRKIN